MARVTIEDCLTNVESRFALVQLAVRRVLQLRRGASGHVEAPKNKEVVLALREIAAGRVSVENIRELEEVEALPVRTALLEDKNIHKEVEELLESEAQVALPDSMDGMQEDLGGEAGPSEE